MCSKEHMDTVKIRGGNRHNVHCVVHAWLSEVMCIGTSRVLFQLYLQSSICLTIILGVNRLGEGASAFGGNPQIFIWKCDAFFCNSVYNLQQNWVFERLKIDLFFQMSNKIHFITFKTVCNSKYKMNQIKKHVHLSLIFPYFECFYAKSKTTIVFILNQICWNQVIYTFMFIFTVHWSF